MGDFWSSGVTIKAEAKINLFLAVLGRRPDGFHQLESLMLRLKLADEIVICQTEDFDSIEVIWDLGSSFDKINKLNDKSFFSGFEGNNNLVLKALRAYRAKTGWPEFFLRIELTKKIPLAAGLAGGSSDAAAILRTLNSSGLLTDKELFDLAASIGSDVPFFLMDSPFCLVRGRGEIISSAPQSHPFGPFVLLNPGLTLSTAEVFAELDLTKPLSRANLSPISLSSNGQNISKYLLGHNDLWESALKLCPKLSEVKQEISRLTNGPFGLSGSGPTFWVLCENLEEAKKMAGFFQKNDWWVTVTSQSEAQAPI
jgi:4-diphosphocytidyl-2-C-methyl-D-erythritol kinase